MLRPAGIGLIFEVRYRSATAEPRAQGIPQPGPSKQPVGPSEGC
jgi:hypothetical protein